MATQNTLFPRLKSKPQRLVPEGFRYEENIISEAEETELAPHSQCLQDGKCKMATCLPILSSRSVIFLRWGRVDFLVGLLRRQGCMLA
jgi:hypothetical protein